MRQALGAKMVRVACWLPEEIDDLLESMARRQRRTKAQLMEAAILYLGAVPKGQLSDIIIEVFELAESGRKEPVPCEEAKPQ